MKPDQKDNYWQEEPAEASETDAPTLDEPDQPLPQDEDDSDEKDVPHDADEIDDEVVNWSAAEYIHVQKGTLWYIIFAGIILLLIVLDILLLHTYTLSLLVVVMAIAVVIYSRRPPADIHYTLSGKQGLYVGEQLYHFSHFKAFGVIRDGEHHFIKFIPMKRLSPGLSIYFPEEVGEQIVDILGARLPMENLKLDAIDIIVRSVRL
jgi:hypothetical protein